jgi:hypothetical protein
MGQMQRRKRKFREAMQEVGQPLPSYRGAAIKAWSKRVVAACEMAKVTAAAIQRLYAIRAASLPRPDTAHTITLTLDHPEGFRGEHVAEILRKANLASKSVIV